MPTPQVDPDADPTSGPATTAEEAMAREAQVDGHVDESAYSPTDTNPEGDTLLP